MAMKEFVRDLDKTGVPVNLNYMGDGEHKTFIGGIASVLACACILPFAIIMIMPIFLNKPDYN